MKTAFITGITGQDGAYMAAHLQRLGYRVVGGYRRSSTPNFWRLRALGIMDLVELVPFNLSDESGIERILRTYDPDEIYNFASQSFVPTSYEFPAETIDANFLGVLRILEAMRQVAPGTKLYQASSSEMFGKAPPPQGLTTPWQPRSPYAIAKCAAHMTVNHYREAYGLHASCGIAFNHESPLRGQEFVTKKISSTLAHIKAGLIDIIPFVCEPLRLGNLDARRDWGFAGDYVEGMWEILQRDEPGDFVLCTGQSHSIMEFVDLVAEALGIELEWVGRGEDLVAIDTNARTIVEIDPKLYRVTDVEDLYGDPTDTESRLGWYPRTTVKQLAQLMAEHDLAEARAIRAR